MISMQEGSASVEQERHAKANSLRNYSTSHALEVRRREEREARKTEFYERHLRALLKDYSDRRSREEKEAAARCEADDIFGTPSEQLLACKTRRNAERQQIWHKFSKSLATEINPESPDVTAALLLYGLLLWMKAAKKARKPLDYCYRSLRELETDYPYLSKGGIEKALARASTRLGKEFQLIRRKDCLRFRLSEKLMKRLEKDKLMMFRIEDAVNFGLSEAIVLANIRWQAEAPQKEDAGKCQVRSDAKLDTLGNRFFEVSPTKLSKVDPFTGEAPILPMSRWTISRALDNLRIEHRVIVQHPVSSTYYTLTSLLEESPLQVPAKAEIDGAKRDGSGAEEDSSGAKRDGLLCVDSNEIVIQDSKVTTLPTASASPALSGVMASPNAKRLMELVASDLQRLQDRQKLNHGQRKRLITVPASQLPYDFIPHPNDDLPYDYVPRIANRVIYTRAHEIRDWIDEIAMVWKNSGFSYKKTDLARLESIFFSVPSFHYEHFEDIWRHLIPNRIPLTGDRDEFRKPANKWDDLRFARSIRNAKQFLKYLPEIIEEMFLTTYWDDKDEMHKEGHLEAPFRGVIDCCRAPSELPVEAVTHDCNPVA